MSYLWHGQVIDRVYSSEMCRLDVWVYEQDRSVLISLPVRQMPDVGTLVLGEQVGDDSVALRPVHAGEWPRRYDPVIPLDRGSGLATGAATVSGAVVTVSSTDWHRGGSLVGDIGTSEDDGPSRRV